MQHSLIQQDKHIPETPSDTAIQSAVEEEADFIRTRTDAKIRELQGLLNETPSSGSLLKIHIIMTVMVVMMTMTVITVLIIMIIEIMKKMRQVLFTQR